MALSALLCKFVIKALLFTRGHNQSLIEFNTETTSIYMFFEKNLVQFDHVKRLNVSGSIHQADCCFSDVSRGRQCVFMSL